MTNLAIKTKKECLSLNADDFNIENINGLIPSIAKTLGAIATIDSIITINEYYVISDAGEHLAKQSKSPLLVSTLVLHYLLHPVSLNLALESLAVSIKEQSSQTKDFTFTILSEVASLQPNRDEIINDISFALELNAQNLSSQATKALSIFSRTVCNYLKPQSSRIEKIKLYATMFNDSKLLSVVQGIEDDRKIPVEIEKLLQLSKKSVLKTISNIKKEVKTSINSNYSKGKFGKITETLLDQVRGRLQIVSKRIDLECDLYLEDFQDLVDDIGIEFEASTQKRNLSSNYIRSDMWTGFIKDEGSRIVKSRYDKLKNRYDKILKLWEAEYASFTKELEVTQNTVMKNYSRRDFQNILPAVSKSFLIRGKVDGFSSGVVDVAATGGLVAVIAAGAGYGGAVLAVFSNPIGLGALGVVGAAGLYNFFTNSDERINNEVSRITTELQKNIVKMLGNPVEKHRKNLEVIEKNFYGAADEKFKPLITNAKILSLYSSYQMKAINEVSETTTSFIESF